MVMSGKTLILNLKKDSETLATLELTKGCAEIFVGRSRSCAMRTPSDDHSVSGSHARVYWKSGCAYIEDSGSKNGIYVNGLRIAKPVKLEDGGIYGIGNCRLVVTRKRKNEVAARDRHHQLEFINGDRAHDIVDICPKKDSTGGLFTLGLDPGNDVVLPDMLVSRRHAAFIVKNDIKSKLILQQINIPSYGLQIIHLSLSISKHKSTKSKFSISL
jgi:hypothetical protein